MRLLDLFCGAGGCSVGYARAEFEVVGVDNRRQPNYPFEFHQADALTFPLEGFDAVHASPPCQVHSKAQKVRGNVHQDLVGPTRKLLEATGLPYVIENVKGAPLKDPVMLEGQMFGLNTHRPRLFETNWPLDDGGMRFPPPRQAKMGRKAKPGEAVQVVGHFTDVEAARAAMGIGWMTRDELSQAIPPAYTEYVGKQLMAHLKVEAA